MEEKISLKILLAEEDPYLQESIAKTLEEAKPSCQVEKVSSWGNTLRKLVENQYHLVLMNYSLPRQEGLEMLKRIQNKGYPTPIIMLVEQGQEESVASAMQDGVFDCVVRTEGYLALLPLAVDRALERSLLLAACHKEEEDVRQRDRQLAALGAIAESLSQAQDLGQVLDRVLAQVLEMLSAEAGGIYILEPLSERLVSFVQRGLAYAFVQKTATLKRSETLARQVLDIEVPVVIEDVPGSPGGEGEEKGASVTCVLLKAKERPVGVMTIFTPLERPPNSQEVKLLIAIGNQIALAIENARLKEEAGDYVRKLEKSNEILQELNRLLEESQAKLEGQLARTEEARPPEPGKVILPDLSALTEAGFLPLTVSRSLLLDEVAGDVMRKALETTSAEAGALFLLEANELRLVAQSGLSESLLQDYKKRNAEEAFFAQALSAPEPLIIPNIAQDADARQVWAEAERKGWRSLLSVPLRAGEKVVGLLCLLAHGQNRFSPKEARLFSLLQGDIGQALESAHLYEESRRELEKLQAENENLHEVNARLEGSQKEMEGLLATMMEAEAEIQLYYKELWTLNSIAETISGSLDLDEILKSAISKMAAVMEAEAACVFLKEEEKSPPRLRARYGMTEEIAQDVGITRLGEDLNALVIETGQSIHSEDISEDERFSRTISMLGGVRSLLAVPLKAKDKVMGAMCVVSLNPRSFSPREVQLLTSISNQVALAVENASLYAEARQSAQELERGNEVLQELNVLLEESQAELEEQIAAIKQAEEEIQRRNQELSALNAIAVALSQSLDFEKVSSDALEKALETLGLTYGELFLFDKEAQEVVLKIRRGQAPAFAFNIETFGLGEGVPGLVAQTKQPIIIEDLSQDDRFIRGFKDDESESHLRPQCTVGIPLLAQERLVGVIDFFGLEKRTFTPHDLSLLTTIGHQIGVAIENVRLFEEIKETAARLEQANEELQELNRLKSDFIAIVSHELRTPLASIMGYVDLMNDEETGPLNEEQKKYLEIIERNTDRLSRLINDILDISRIEAGRMDLLMQPLNLNELVQEVITTMQPQASEKELRVFTFLPEGVPITQGDIDRVRQVVVNLLSNAIKFTPEGGEIRVSNYAVRIAEAAAEPMTALPPHISQKDLTSLRKTLPEGSWLLASVADTGMGIPKEVLHKIFEKFYQVGGAARQKMSGSGLGLSIAKGIARAHGGEIWAESPGPGKGATFTLALPIIEEPIKLPMEEERMPIMTGLGTLLVVDDDPDIVNLVRLYLEEEGYNVIPAYNGKTALKAAEEMRPTAIVLDLLMPDLDGFAVLERLKSNPATRDTPVIIVSILADKEKGFSLGAVDYLTKPIDRQRLVAAVQRLVLPPARGDELSPILVVDDDREITGLIEVYLQGEGFPVKCAYNGLEAMARVRQEIPSLIILDILMPEMDGFEVVQALKSNSRTRNIPLIILTAKDLTEEERSSLQLGATRYLTKTLFSRERLLAEVGELLGRISVSRT